MSGSGAVDDAALRRLTVTTTALVYVQILVGAAMRHTGAGLAIPDFPLMFGGIVPDRWSGPIAVHFTHRVGALVVTLAVIATGAWIWFRQRTNPALARPALLLAGLIAVQFTLGALTVLSQRDVAVNSAHVVCGAMVLATSLVLTLRSWRIRFGLSTAIASARSAAARHAVSPSPRSPHGARA
jgi:cytochrome c oxidase assembly protein subunit 15